MKLMDCNYMGKKVFVGIDVHKKNYVLVALCEGVFVKKWSTPAGGDSIAEQLLRFFSGAIIESGYEAGFSGFSLHRALTKAGIHSKVVHAASIPVESNNRVKTDKRDARKIAEQLSFGKLKCINIPSEDEEARRSLSRGREQAVSRRKSIGNQLVMKLHYLGFSLPEKKKMSENLIRWIETLDMASEHKFYIEELIDAWRQESQRVKRFENASKIQAGQDKCEKIYRSAPGIGAVSSRILSNELGDMSRFDNERQLFSNSGLTPTENSSGEQVRRGHISRQGSSRIRAVLVEVAWRAIDHDKSLKDFYLRLAHHRNGKRAIVAVARKILGRLRKCFKDGVEWKEVSPDAKVAA